MVGTFGKTIDTHIQNPNTIQFQENFVIQQKKLIWDNAVKGNVG